MKIISIHFILTAAAILSGAGSEVLSAEAIVVSPIASPAAANDSDHPSLTTGPDGTVWLSWLEASGEADVTLKFATLAPGSSRWSAPRAIFSQANWVANVFDSPLLVAQGGGRVTAVWSSAVADKDGNVGSPHAHVSQTTDDGARWSSPKLLSSESESVEYVSLVPVAGDRLLATWIDARGRKTEATAPKLYSRLIGSEGPDTVVDGSVCDCCRSSLAQTDDGGAILAYRGRTDGQIRDILTARFEDGRWEDSRVSTADGWKIDGCPVNGPRISSQGHNVSLVWFTGAGEKVHVLTKSSEDEGKHFGSTQQVDLGSPGGRLDTSVTRDGIQIVTWLENTGADAGTVAGLYLRSYSKAGPLLAPTLVASLVNDPVGRVFPRMALVQGNTGGPTRVVIAYTRPGISPHVETLVVSLPQSASSA